MEWAQIPVIQLGAVGVLFAVLWLVFTGRLVPRSTLDDVRADRDARIAEAAADADAWRELYVGEREAHQTTRQAHAEEVRAALVASTEGAAVAAALLTEIRSRQIGAISDT
ncbi:hypothetical protein ACFFMN_34025 [Planobispora siamensis]|uniref:Uncharacterized protein n=1 Tax=Planobispora siamensis TaxID=936338 RepID=A0A8J3SD41_9ACTN|nr:hypothetical protein [Planobispora siamensis]GIH91928.1 hypothetical protein Psi01_25580 [Planobispora siamensis]